MIMNHKFPHVFYSCHALRFYSVFVHSMQHVCSKMFYKQHAVKLAAPIATQFLASEYFLKGKDLSNSSKKQFCEQPSTSHEFCQYAKCKSVAHCWHPLCPCLHSCKWHLHQISQELFIFQILTDPFLNPKGKSVTFVHFSRKILRSCTNCKGKAVPRNSL